MVESIKLIDEYERSIAHFLQPVVLQFQVLCACRSDPLEGNFPTVHQTIQHIFSRNAGGELKDLPTHFVQVVSKIISKAVS